MTVQHQFTELRMRTPYDNLRAAISILQSHILASDTGFNPEVLFGGNHYTTAQLETAVALLVGIIEPVDEVVWPDDAQQVA